MVKFRKSRSNILNIPTIISLEILALISFLHKFLNSVSKIYSLLITFYTKETLVLYIIKLNFCEISNQQNR